MDKARQRDTCPECKSIFVKKSMNQKFCSSKCRYRARDSKPERMEADRQRHRESYAAGAPVYDRPRRPNKRAEFYGVEHEPIEPKEIFERDGWICGVCNEAVDQSLVYPDPQCASLDHIIPWSAGGSHLKSNVQCTHLVCNLRKSSHLPDSKALAGIGDRA